MVGLELMMTLVPGGARGAALKSNCPLIKGFADNFILELASLIIFYVKNSWSRRQYHSEMGYLDATKTIHKKNLWMALYSELALGVCGGTNWAFFCTL